MRLIQLAAGRKYGVWAVCDEMDDETCQVLEMLLVRVLEEHPDLQEMMTPLLFEEVPNEGPPFDDPRRAKRLYREILWELKADKGSGTKNHIGLRIAFFFDDTEPDQIICTNAFYKQENTPQQELDKALAERARYFTDKSNHRLVPELGLLRGAEDHEQAN